MLTKQLKQFKQTSERFRFFVFISVFILICSASWGQWIYVTKDGQEIYDTIYSKRMPRKFKHDNYQVFRTAFREYLEDSKKDGTLARMPRVYVVEFYRIKLKSWGRKDKVVFLLSKRLLERQFPSVGIPFTS